MKRTRYDTQYADEDLRSHYFPGIYAILGSLDGNRHVCILSRNCDISYIVNSLCIQ